MPLNRHTSTLLDCTDWSAVFKISRVHVTPVAGLESKKKSGKFKHIYIYNHIKYVTLWEREINSFQPYVKKVLSFLTELYENGLGYSAINTARSALSSYGIQHSGVSIGSNNLVIRCLKGVFNLRHGKPRL